jgi:hypothetical protein
MVDRVSGPRKETSMSKSEKVKEGPLNPLVRDPIIAACSELQHDTDVADGSEDWEISSRAALVRKFSAVLKKHRIHSANVPVKRGTPSPQVAGSAFCEWTETDWRTQTSCEWSIPLSRSGYAELKWCPNCRREIKRMPNAALRRGEPVASNGVVGRDNENG